MPRSTFIAATLLTVLSLSPRYAPLAAQESASTATIGLSGGVLAPVGDFGDVAKSGWHLQASLAGRPPLFGGPALRLDALYGSVGGRDGTLGSIGTDLWTVNLNVMLAMGRPEGGVRPFLIGGAGYYSLKRDADGAQARGVVGFNGGGGLEANVGQGLEAFLEVRYHHAVKALRGGLLGEDRAAAFVPVSIGVRF